MTTRESELGNAWARPAENKTMGTADVNIRRTGLQRRVAHWHPAAAVASVVVSGYVVMCLLFAGIGLLVTHQLGSLTRWDDSVNRWFAQHRTGSTNDWTSYATKVANTSGILVVLVLAAVVLFLFKHRWSALMLLIALGLELLTFLTVNYLVDRPRPDVERLGALPSTSSYPSGHTAATIALYGGLAVLISARVRSWVVWVITWVVAVALATAIGFARVYRGMHHPSDVVVGALVGLAALGVAILAVRTGRMATSERRRLRSPGSSVNPGAAA
jgi:undecaprenyl-diphosphatase